MKGSSQSKSQLSFPERLRKRREELRWTREDLKRRIEARGGIISIPSIRKMEQQGANRYRLPKRPGRSLIEDVADALGVPLGYLLAGFSRKEIEDSIFAQKFKNGEIPIIDTLDPREKEPYADFLTNLPSDESSLLGLPLHSFRNERAFAIVFRFEQIYSGLEMLIVNEPPLIFWDDEDVERWIRNMRLARQDVSAFRDEFARYRTHFRRLAQKEKRYKVVLNLTTFCKFLRIKSAAQRVEQIDDMIDFLKFPTFNLVLLEPAKNSEAVRPTSDEILECEVISKHTAIPDSLEDTLSVVIRQTPSQHDPVEYFVAPIPQSRLVLQMEKTRIEDEYARAVDQYEMKWGNLLPSPHELSDESIKKITRHLLEKIKGEMRHL